MIKIRKELKTLSISHVVFFLLGPLTLTKNGITILYGVASMLTPETEDVEKFCTDDNVLYGRVSGPSILKWITSNIQPSV